MEARTLTATLINDCLRTRFYGVHQLLELKARKTYNSSVKELIERSSSEILTILRSLTNNCNVAILIYREYIMGSKQASM